MMENRTHNQGVKRILFVSDNRFLIEKIHKMVDDRTDMICTFVRTGGNVGSYMSCPTDMASINIKTDYASLMGKYDLIFSIHCMQIFPAALVSSVRCINVHPGYNPFNRGWYPQVFGIINNKPCGATIHEMDAELDHGGIIAQREVEVLPWDNSRTVYDKVLATEIVLLKENLDSIVNGSYSVYEPAIEGNVNTKKDYRELCQLDLNEVIRVGDFVNRLRALSHPPYKNAYFITEDGVKVSVSIEMERV